MCGLFGFCAYKGKQVNLQKIKYLGLYNTERGTDSCGYYYSGHIAKGTYLTKHFGEFIAQEPIQRGNFKHDIFMGHTRKSTWGALDEKNAHPHLVNDQYVQTHNGIIKNDSALAKKYDISWQTANLDSMILANIIYEHGFKVLEEYDGYAALAMVNKQEPNSIYLYHGASREFIDDELPTSERPLYILKQPEGLYYSSISESLDGINETDDIVESLIHNYVFKITDGIIQPKPVRINRQDVGARTRYVTPVSVNNNNRNNCGHLLGNGNGNAAKKQQGSNVSSINNKENKKDEIELNTDDKIFSEVIETVSKQELYFQKGRYYGSSGKLLHGGYTIDRDGLIIPPDMVKDKKYRIPEEFYFYFGIMIINKHGFDSLTTQDIKKTDHVPSLCSRYSRFPVICLEDEFIMHKNVESRYLWFDAGYVNKAKKVFDPRFSNNTYAIQNGKTLYIIPNKNKIVKVLSIDTTPISVKKEGKQQTAAVAGRF